MYSFRHYYHPRPVYHHLLISGDIQTNPGPQEAIIYPCGVYNLKVDWSHHALCCDNCDEIAVMHGITVHACPCIQTDITP